MFPDLTWKKNFPPGNGGGRGGGLAPTLPPFLYGPAIFYRIAKIARIAILKTFKSRKKVIEFLR